MSDKKFYYVVGRMQTEIQMAWEGEEIMSGGINGLAGFLPVYATAEEAEKMSDGGRYKIWTITALEEE